MTDQAKESFSSFLDDEATELDVQRMLNELERNPALMDEYRQLAVSRDLAQGGQGIDLTAAISSAIQNENAEADVSEPVQKTQVSWFQKSVHQITRVSIAASVTLAVVIGARWWVDQGPASVQVAQQQSAVEAEQLVAAQERLQQYLQQHAQQAAFTSGHPVMPFEPARPDTEDEPVDQEQDQ
jgi:sigma-E factor negative regulatory protein RseA